MSYAVEWHEYLMEHSVCPQEIADMQGWLLRVLGCSSLRLRLSASSSGVNQNCSRDTVAADVTYCFILDAPVGESLQ